MNVAGLGEYLDLFKRGCVPMKAMMKLGCENYLIVFSGRNSIICS